MVVVFSLIGFVRLLHTFSFSLDYNKICREMYCLSLFLLTYFYMKIQLLPQQLHLKLHCTVVVCVNCIWVHCGVWGVDNMKC